MSERGEVRARLAAAAFAVGSLCFAFAALPSVADAIGAVAANVVFVTGSGFFTAGAALSLGVPDRTSSVLQLIGTVFFNVSTTVALAAAAPAGAVGGTGWRPDVYGSACFLVSSALALATVARLHAGARDRGGAWLNLTGSVLFGAAAVGAYPLPGTDTLLSPFWSGVGTVGGALCFLAAAVLGLLPEPRAPQRTVTASK